MPLVLIRSSARRVVLCFVALLMTALLSATSSTATAQVATQKTVAIGTDFYTGLLLASDGNFYTKNEGVVVEGCADNEDNNCSTIYKVAPDGTTTVFHNFQETSSLNNTDGLQPTSLIEASDGNFYGTCAGGGSLGYGTIFKIAPDGTFTLLYDFPGTPATATSNSNATVGQSPKALVEGTDGFLYGVAMSGIPPAPAGDYGPGLFFRIDKEGSAFTQVHIFSQNSLQTNEGSYPSSLVQGDDGDFYVTMQYGQTSDNLSAPGGIDRVTASGDVTPVANFASDGSQGSNPMGPLAEGSDGSLYGISSTSSTPPDGMGHAFKMSKTGTIQTIHHFTGGTQGLLPHGPLLMGSDGNFYGDTADGGDTTNPNCFPPYGCGLVFQLTPSGVFTALHDFEGGIATSSSVAANPKVDGATPSAPIVQGPGGIFYGATEGNSASATVFSLSLANAVPSPIQLSLDPSPVAVGSTAVLTWSVLNAYSKTAQLCSGTISPNPAQADSKGVWNGRVQTGSLAGSVYSGSATVTPVAGGVYQFALTCGGQQSGFATLTVGGMEEIENTTLPDSNVGEPYSVTLVAEDGTAPYTWSIDSVTDVQQASSKPHSQDTPPAGTLPQGLSLNPTTGVISGTPMQAINVAVTVTATDSAMPPHMATTTLPLVVNSTLKIVTTSLVKGTIGGNYKQTLAAMKGIAPYKWSITAGTLPDGLTLDANSGMITGQPTKEGVSTLTFQVADSEPTPATKTVTLALTIKPDVQIAAVEFTQVIQQYQTLDDLNASLMANGEPPVPIVSGKPAVMRVYFTSLKDAAGITLTATGVPAGTGSLLLPPSCAPTDARGHIKGCPSVDLYFTPPSGTWTTSLTLTDLEGNQLETETFTVTSRDTYGINLKGVKTCIRGAVSGCSDVSKLLTITGLTQTLWPTASVTSSISPSVLSSTFAMPLTDNGRSSYIAKLSLRANKLFTPSNSSSDATNKTRTAYVAIYPLAAGNSGAVAELPGHGLVIGDSFMGDITPQPDYLAHEFGHTINELHTNNGLPGLNQPLTPPGCYAVAQDPDTSWPFGNNNIQSSNGLEYGFNVAAQTVIDPTISYDIMGYCVPDWVSPINYKLAFILLGSTAVTSPSAVHAEAASPKDQTLVSGQYLQVSGSIATTNGVAAVTLDPIFTQTIAGSSDPGSGTWSIQIKDQTGNVLYTRSFTPTVLEGDPFSTGVTDTPNPIFSEWIPVTSGAASIAVLDPTGNTAGTVALTGAAPTVTITSPGAGFTGSGMQTVSWTVLSASATNFTSRIFYSTDAGKTYQQIDETTDTSDTIDFSTLPGSTTAVIRVDVSDGVNTGSATSSVFQVSKKMPSTIAITSPATGAIFPAANPLFLSGVAYDADDGVLTGPAIKWSDDVQGALGTGSPLTVTLKPGTHNVTLTGTDSDGNSVTATTRVTLGGDPPVVSLITNATGASCGTAAINAVPGANGADLVSVTYSLDGGVTYTQIALNSLPFTVTGSGAVNLVATAIDASGQTGAQSVEITLGTTCGPQSVTASSGSGQTAVAGQTFAMPLTAKVADSNGNLLSGISLTFAAPASGAGAALSATSVTTGSDGTASVMATANQSAGSYVVTVSVSGVATPAIFNLTNTAPAEADFQVAASSTSLTVTHGGSVADTLSFTALNGFASAISLSCSGLPAGASCSFSPPTLTPGPGGASSQLTIRVSDQAAVFPIDTRKQVSATVLLCGVFVLWPLLLKRKKLSSLWILALFAISIGTVGCDGSSSRTTHTTVTITAQSGTVIHTTAIALTIE